MLSINSFSVKRQWHLGLERVEKRLEQLSLNTLYSGKEASQARPHVSLIAALEVKAGRAWEFTGCPA